MNTTTLEQMRKMHFFGMFRAFKTSLETNQRENSTPDELIAQLIQAEWDERQNRNIERKVKNARFRYNASFEQMYYNTDRNIDRNQIMRFNDCTFINKNEVVLITGCTGIGKSYIASAIGHHACSLGYKVVYHNVPKLFAKLKMAKADGSYIKEIAKKTGAKEFHTSAKMFTNGKMNFLNPAMAEDLQHLITDEDEIRKMVGML